MRRRPKPSGPSPWSLDPRRPDACWLKSGRDDMVESDPLASRDSDEAFREIELNGKQLVFLFMVAAVASVVIFLCGVFVGRGVRAERLADGQSAAPGAVATPDDATAAAPAPPPTGSDPTTAPAP